MLKLSSKRICRSLSKLGGGRSGGATSQKRSENGSSCGGSTSPKGSEKGSSCGGGGGGGEVKWEVRPGGMLVQRRDAGGSDQEEIITLRVSTVSTWHHISIDATSTFGELKMILSVVTGLEVREQRILFKGKEREDGEYLHMVGVKDKDKVLLLQDPAIKDMKLHRMAGAGGGAGIEAAFRTISV